MAKASRMKPLCIGDSTRMDGIPGTLSRGERLNDFVIYLYLNHRIVYLFIDRPLIERL